jgi:hypothetical protein
LNQTATRQNVAQNQEFVVKMAVFFVGLTFDLEPKKEHNEL